MEKKTWKEFVKEWADTSDNFSQQKRKSAIFDLEIDEVNKLLAEASEQAKEEQE